MCLAATNPLTWHMRTCSHITDLSGILFTESTQNIIECRGNKQKKSVRCPLRRRKWSHSFPKAQYPTLPFTCHRIWNIIYAAYIHTYTHYQKCYIWRSLACGYWNIKIYMNFCDEHFSFTFDKLDVIQQVTIMMSWIFHWCYAFDGVGFVGDTRLWRILHEIWVWDGCGKNV